MVVNTNTLVPMTDANQNFSKVMKIKLGNRTVETVAIYFEKANHDEIKKMLPQKAKTMKEALDDYEKTRLPGATSYGKTILVDEKYIGDIWCYCVDAKEKPNAMISYCIFEMDYWKKGIATEAVRLFIEEIKQRMKVESIGTFTYSTDIASINVLEKNNFVFAEEFAEDEIEFKYYQYQCRQITVIYSPLCEANGSFIEKLKEWVSGYNVKMDIYPFNAIPEEYRVLMSSDENCFISVYYNGKQIDSVPLHRERILSELGVKDVDIMANIQKSTQSIVGYTEEEIRHRLYCGNLTFIPITKETYMEEMSMCLFHYPMENPPKEHHAKCVAIKEQVFSEVWKKEKCAGVYVKLNGAVVGLLEVMPREIVKKYGYMTGKDCNDDEVLTVACYEVAGGIPRTFIIDELMYHLLRLKNNFSRKILEGIGIIGWNDGFNPYWVYEKYGFSKSEQKRKDIMVMSRDLR